VKRLLWLCAFSAATAVWAGCGGSTNYSPVAPKNNGGTSVGASPTAATLPIPTTGGSVTPGDGSDGIVATEIFASAPSGATVTISDSGESIPANAPLPVNLGRSQAAGHTQGVGAPLSVVFHSSTLSFNEAMTGSQYTSHVLTADVPAFGAPYTLTVGDTTTKPATVLFTSTGTLSKGVLTFPVPASASFAAGHAYVAEASAQQATLLQMQVVNQTSLPAYVFIKSGNPTDGGGNYYANGVGLLVPMNAADGSLNKPNPGWTPTPPQAPSTSAPAQGGNYFVTSSAYVRPVLANTTIPIPLGRSERIYFSVSRPIAIQVNYDSTAGSLWAPSAPWSTPGEVNIDTPFDWIETNFFIDNNGVPTFGPNNTSLQMFGLPLSYTLAGPNGTVTAGFTSNARSQILAAVRSNSVYSTLIYAGNNPSVNPVRVISPDNGIFNLAQNRIGLPTMDKTVLQAYLDSAWTYYQTHNLVFHSSDYGDYTGTVNTANSLVLTSSLSGQPTLTIGKPSVYWAIVNGGLVNDANAANCTASPLNNGQCEEVTSMLSAGFNRGLLAQSNPPYSDQLYRKAPCDQQYVRSFYTNPTPGYLNLYAKIMHQFSYPTPDAINGGSYGFGFEDNCDQSSLISGNAQKAPTLFTVTINPM